MKQDSLNVHEYGLKFTQLSLYDSDMVKYNRSGVSFLVAGLVRASSIEGRPAMFNGNMDTSRIMVYVRKVE